jgi:DNA-binding MarR family transcriptional regulator
MAASKSISVEAGREVRDRCLCFHTQRAARKLARRFDAAFAPLGITNGQFSTMMMLNNTVNPQIRQVADFLAMDRTTLTAALKTLQHRGLVSVVNDPDDRRIKRVSLTATGARILKSALPIWRSEHALLESERPHLDVDQLRSGLRAIA